MRAGCQPNPLRGQDLVEHCGALSLLSCPSLVSLAPLPTREGLAVGPSKPQHTPCDLCSPYGEVLAFPSPGWVCLVAFIF